MPCRVNLTNLANLKCWILKIHHLIDIHWDLITVQTVEFHQCTSTESVTAIVVTEFMSNKKSYAYIYKQLSQSNKTRHYATAVNYFPGKGL